MEPQSTVLTPSPYPPYVIRHYKIYHKNSSMSINLFNIYYKYVKIKRVIGMEKQKKKVTGSYNDELVKDLKKELTNKVKEKITKQIVDDVKKDVSVLVYEDVSSNLKKELSREIKKENKKVLRVKRGKILRRDFLILFLLFIIFYLLYFMYNHNYISFNINSNISNVSVDNDKKGNNNYNDLLSLVNVNLPFDNINSLYLYRKNYTVENINDAIKLNMAYNSLMKDEFTSDEIKDKYVSLFGSDKYFKNTSFDYGCKHFKYDSTLNKYIVSSNDCVTISSFEIIEKILDTKKNGDIVTIITVVGIYDKEDKSLYNHKNLYTKISSNLSTNFSLLDYKDKLSKYKYTFKCNSDICNFVKITSL